MSAEVDHLSAFLEAKAILNAEDFKWDDATLQKYGRSTGVKSQTPIAVAYPRTTEHVQLLMAWATKHAVGLYPISCGKNWGYGDAQPSGMGQVVLDLGRMNRIIEVNPELAYTVIEPGVTQQQLYEHLKDNDYPLWMDCTGAGLDASLVGNTLDRGFGHTRYGDHFLTCCGMEVVLADGRVLNTGLGHYENARAERVYPYGVGPSLDGLFVQSNFGIVTKIGLWLMPKPEAFSAFFFFAEEEDELAELVDRLAPLRRQGLLQSTIHIGNDLRILSARSRYPWDKTGGKTPLPPDVRKDLRREHTVSAWTGGGAIYGTRDMVKATERAVKKALKPFKVKILNDRRLTMAHRIRKLLGCFGGGQRLEQILKVIEPVCGLMKGIPTNEPRRGATWRVRDREPDHPQDPLDAHAGLIWTSPVLPNRGADAAELMNLIEPIYERHGFEAMATFTMITERAMVCVTNISFDKRVEREVSAANACYAELMEAMMAAGYLPYRTAPSGYSRLRQNSTVFWDVAAQLKGLLDPNDVVSPGRYIEERGDQRAELRFRSA